ncbi:MAG: beta-ketoacyl-ACP synthase II [Deltaproteobacteria bacterium]|nr:beta-ketoacyl-ACP synthase II [Deltaproteobacteria bacterium]
MAKERVVVTGMGLVTSLATGVEQTWQKLLAGECGIRTIQKFDATGLKSRIAGEVLDFNPDDWMAPKLSRRLDVFTHYAVAASRMAWTLAGLPDPLDEERSPRAGCVVGVGLGGLLTLTEGVAQLLQKGPAARISPFFIPKIIGNMAPGIVSMELNLKGPNLCITTACAAGTHAIGEAAKFVAHGGCDLILAGGAESVISPTTLAGFAAAKALSTNNDDPCGASRPFDAKRDGFIMAEGAGMLVLESLTSARARGATIYAELVGYGITADAYHMTAPDPEAKGFIGSMQMALDMAGLAPEDVDYINAHGTSTDLNDAAESMAIRRVFGAHADRLMVSSTKSMLGHSLGATGGVEAVVSVLTIRDGKVAPTINYHNPDPACDLDYVPNQMRVAPVRTVLSNSFGFGGTNGTVIFRALAPEA